MRPERGPGEAQVSPPLNQKSPLAFAEGFPVWVGGDLLSHTDAVSSALPGLTSLFGMGRGAPRRHSRHMSLSGHGGGRKEPFTPKQARDPRPRPRGRTGVRSSCHFRFHCFRATPRLSLRRRAQALGPLVPLGSTCRHASTCGLSTW